MWDVPTGPPAEKTAIDVTIEPEDTREVRIALTTGEYVGPVRAYVEEHLVFCRSYVPRPYAGGETWNVEVVEGRVDCQ